MDNYTIKIGILPGEQILSLCRMLGWTLVRTPAAIEFLYHNKDQGFVHWTPERLKLIVWHFDYELKVLMPVIPQVVTQNRFLEYYDGIWIFWKNF